MAERETHEENGKAEFSRALGAELAALAEPKPEKPGEFLGDGLQYKVYEIQNGRVRKLSNTAEESAQKLADWNGESDPTAAQKQAAEEVFAATRDNEAHFKKLLDEYPELGEYLANPSFLPEGGYDQDKSQTLHELLAAADPEQARAVFESYAYGKLLEWEYGFSDASFNPTVNNAVNEHGEVVLLDFGDASTDPEKIEKDIEQKRWLTQWSYVNDIPEPLKPIFAEVMDSIVTKEAFDENWEAMLYRA